MAEISASAPSSRSSKPRLKKKAFRLDMTPMVDLAFLLLTFFILTASFNKPTTMQLTMPVKGPSSSIKDSNALTLILGKAGQVHYFRGLNQAGPGATPPELLTTNFGPDGLRQVLLKQQRQQPETFVLIKSGPDAKYRDLVNALDEMNITDQHKYALVDLDAADRALLKSRAL